MRINNSAKPQRREPSRKQDESIDITLDPPYISPDSPFKEGERDNERGRGKREVYRRREEKGKREAQAMSEV